MRQIYFDRHLAPYLNGVEINMEGALRIGVLPEADFSVMHFQLAPGDTLMLMSDGVAEAQDVPLFLLPPGLYRPGGQRTISYRGS